MKISEKNFMLYAAHFYDNPSCESTEEFYDDLNRFKYIKRLFTKYENGSELKERLIMNHIIVLYNLFGPAATRMLLFKLQGQWQYLKPFLIKLGYMPEIVEGIDGLPPTNNSDIQLDQGIVDALRNV